MNALLIDIRIVLSCWTKELKRRCKKICYNTNEGNKGEVVDVNKLKEGELKSWDTMWKNMERIKEKIQGRVTVKVSYVYISR